MHLLTRSTLLGLLAALVLPALAEARQQRPSNDMWTRSVALNMRQAREAPNQERREHLFRLALESAQDGLESNPSNPQIWLMAGQAFLAVANFEPPEQATELYREADAALARAVEMYPDYGDDANRERQNAWTQAYNAGVNALNQGNNELAVQHLERADVIYQGRPEARFSLGGLYHRAGDTERAIEMYQGALALLTAPPQPPGQPPAGGRGGRGAFGRGGAGGMSPEERANMAEAAAFNLAQILASVGRHEDAADAYMGLLARDPENLTAKMNLAIVLSRLERGAEAAEIYASLLTRDDLTASDLFNMGIGLYQAQMYDGAAEAFDRTIELNPYMRDAANNALMAWYALAMDLESSYLDAEGEARQLIAGELVPVYQRLIESGDRLHAVDPLNLNAIAIKARGFRGLGDMTEDEEKSMQWRQQALDLIAAHEELPYHVAELRASGAGRAVGVQGSVVNLTRDAGESVTLRFTFFGGTDVLGTQDVTVTLREAGEGAPFQLQQNAEENITGWKYEVVE